MVHLVVIGAGWAGKHHAEAVRRHPNAELAAIVDGDEEKAKSLSKLMGHIPTFRTVSDLFQSNVSFDGGLVCTLPATHISISRMFVKNGKHVLCEKPMGREPEPIAELYTLAVKKNVKVGINCNQRFAPTLRKLKQHIGNKEKVHMVQASMHQNGPKTKSTDYPDDLLISDACIHMIDSLRFLNGEIAAVHACSARIDSEIISDVAVNLQFTNGSIGTMAHTYVGSERSPGQHPFQYYQLSTDQARYTVENLVDRLTVYPHKELYNSSWSPSVFAPKGYETSMWASVSEWIECIANNTSVPVDMMDAYKNTKVVKACIASIETGQPISVEDD